MEKKDPCADLHHEFLESLRGRYRCFLLKAS